MDTRHLLGSIHTRNRKLSGTGKLFEPKYNEMPNGGKSKANLKGQRSETTSIHLNFCCSDWLWADLTLALKRLPHPPRSGRRFLNDNDIG